MIHDSYHYTTNSIAMRFTLFSLLASLSTVFAVTCNTKLATDASITGEDASASILGCLTVQYCAESPLKAAVPCTPKNHAYTILSAVASGKTCESTEKAAMESDAETGKKTTCCTYDHCNVVEDAATATLPVIHATETVAEALVATGTSTTTATASQTSGVSALIPGFAALLLVVYSLVL
jgi:hypothetical protein